MKTFFSPLAYSSKHLQLTRVAFSFLPNIMPVALIRQMLLNKTRTNVSVAFQWLQKISSHSLQDYMAHVVSDLPPSGVEPRLTFQ